MQQFAAAKEPLPPAGDRAEAWLDETSPAIGRLTGSGIA
jgi:hypothetical protein